MASQKVRPPVLPWFFKTLTDKWGLNLYSVSRFIRGQTEGQSPTKTPLRLVGRNFCLVISFVFARSSELTAQFALQNLFFPMTFSLQTFDLLLTTPSLDGALLRATEINCRLRGE